MRDWTFLSHHAQVLVCVANDPHMRLREIAACVGITERAAHRIVVDLEASGFLTRHREGARNAYELHLDRILPHPVIHDRSLGQFLAALASGTGAVPPSAPRPAA